MSASLTRRVIYFMPLALYHMYRYWRLDQEGLLDHYAQMSKVQVSERHLRRGSSVLYVLKFYLKTNISYLFITTFITRLWLSGGKKCSFSGKFCLPTKSISRG